MEEVQQVKIQDKILYLKGKLFTTKSRTRSKEVQDNATSRPTGSKSVMISEMVKVRSLH